MNTLVVYHGNDHDGECSAAIYRISRVKRHPACESLLRILQLTDNTPISSVVDLVQDQTPRGDGVILLPIDRGRRSDEIEIAIVEMLNEQYAVFDLVILDYSFSYEFHSAVGLSRCNSTWIDHHPGSIAICKELKEHDIRLPAGVRLEGKAACELTWDYLFPDCFVPSAVRLLGRYDVWDHEDPNVVPFEYGLRIRETFPSASIWDDMIAGWYSLCDMKKVICEGSAIVNYEQKVASREVERHGIDISIGTDDKFDKRYYGIGMSWGTPIVVGMFETARQLASRRWNRDIEFAVLFYMMKSGQWKYSLRRIGNSDVNLLPLAKKFGGGGHHGACGFVSSLGPREVFDVIASMPGTTIMPDVVGM